MKSTRVVKVAIGLMAFGVAGPACTERQVQTELEPEGPPVIKQVLMQARVMVGPSSERTMFQLAYGSHPDINDDSSIEELGVTIGPVLAASARSNRIRVVFDELLVGNYLEEIACFDGSYSRVPRGASPDDITKCAGSDPSQLLECTGDYAVCIGDDGPIGILDCNADGAVDPDSPAECITGNDPVDGIRMIGGIFTIECDGVEITWDREQSFHQPAGNQLISAGPLGVNSLGPAIIIVPQNPGNDLLSGMRTGANCSLVFDDNVVDSDNIQPCAPADGDDCVPGDTSGIGWTVEPLRLTGSAPTADAINVALGNPNSSAIVQFNAALDDATLFGITIADETITFPDCASPPVGQCVQRSRSGSDPTLATITVVGGYTPTNLHTVTIPTSLTDIFGGPLPAEISYTFTTRAP